MGTTYAPLFVDLFPYSHEADFIQGILKKNEKKLALSFNFTFLYTDDVLLLNNSRLCDFVDRIYPIELQIKDTTDTARSISYLDLHLEIDNEGRLRTKLYDKRDYLKIPNVNFPFICSNFPAGLCCSIFRFLCCFSLIPSSFGHCVVCPSIYGFGLTIWYLHAFLIIKFCIVLNNAFFLTAHGLKY